MIRKARKEDASQAVELVKIVLKDMELPIFGQISESLVDELLKKAFCSDEMYRYSYTNAIVKEIDHQVAGIAFGYPGKDESKIDDVFKQLLISYQLPVDFQLFHDKEAMEDEWYLDTIVTSNDFRGRGVAKELLNAVADVAYQSGCHKLGLNVDEVNQLARNIYEKNGFKKVAECYIASHLYDHMQKTI